jgi:endogenous inhibitor of DNA gyrase (YacG/DUF329 family)
MPTMRNDPSPNRNDQLPQRPCRVCGKLFAATRRDRRYCSPKCKQVAHRRRIKDAEPVHKVDKAGEKTEQTQHRDDDRDVGLLVAEEPKPIHDHWNDRLWHRLS